MQKMRGTEGKTVADMKEEMDKKLQNVQTVEEMKTVLESAMFRIDHPLQQRQDAVDGEESGQRKAEQETDVSKRQIVFDERLGKEKPRGKLVRYQTEASMVLQ